MGKLRVNQRRLKVSPAGLITLPVSARKALGMTPRAGSKVTVAVTGKTVTLRPAGGDDGGFRVSGRGQMELRGDALALVTSGSARHYWLEMDDEKATVVLHPAE